MAQITDDFSTDPSGRWTTELGSAPTWDSGNGEYDINIASGDAFERYSNSSPGSIDHEAQVTALATSSARLPMALVRAANDGTDDAYGASLGTADGLNIYRYNAGARTTIYNNSPTITAGNYYTLRMSAEGSGATVTLNVWIQDHGTTKPTDPGWIGSVGSPDYTHSDVDAGRLVNGSLHLHCGIGGRTGGTDDDTRHDFWKAEAISDRGGGGGSTNDALLVIRGA